MDFIKTKDQLPPEGKYVIGRHNRGTWIDDDDQDNVNVVVVKLIKGISKEERQQLKASDNMELVHEHLKPVRYTDGTSPRWNEYHSSDEYANNHRPYYWNAFGPDSFFGQDIFEWKHIN